MKWYGLTIIIFFMGFPLFVSCERQTGLSTNGMVSKEKTTETMREGTGTVGLYTHEEEKEAYQKLIEDKVDEYHKKVDKLKAKAEAASDEVKSGYNLNIELLQNKVKVADKKLNELKYASGKAWEDIRTGVDAVMSDFEKHYDRVVSRSE